MNDWKKYKLGEFADVQNGFAFKANDFKSFGIPIIKIKNIKPPNISFEDAQYFNGQIDNRLKQFFIFKKDILISMTGSHVSQISSAVGKVGRYGFDSPALLNQRVGKLYSKDKTKLNADYLYYLVARPEVQFELATSAGGSANQANISPQQIKNLEFEIPDIKTQSRIASILSSLDDKIELNRRMNQTLEQMAQALFNHYFVDNIDPDNLPEGWRNEKIGNILQTILGGTPSTSKDEYWNDGNVAWINSGKANEFRIVEPTTYITNEGLKKSNTKLLPRGTSIIAITGATMGKISRLEISSCANQSIVGILENELLSSEFIYFWLKFKRSDILSHGTGGAQQHINKNDINETDIIMPEEIVRIQFQRIVKPIFDKISNNCFENLKLQNIRDTLLPKLMSGEVDVDVLMKEETLLQEEAIENFKTA